MLRSSPAVGAWFVGFLSACARPASEPPLRVAAASDLARAFEEIATDYARTHPRPAITFGSTGLLAEQIRHGAPFDVFAAASRAHAEQLAGRCDASSIRVYARGRIVMWTPTSSGVAPGSLHDLSGPAFRYVAIANPAHAPYGQAAEAALRALGLRDALQPKLVFADNVLQARQLAESGNADAAIIALSLATGPEGRFVTIDEALHPPIEQAIIVCASGKRRVEAAAFASFLDSPGARSTLQRFGFVVP